MNIKYDPVKVGNEIAKAHDRYYLCKVGIKSDSGLMMLVIHRMGYENVYISLENCISQEVEE